MLASYNFSIRGKSHIKSDKPCQDSSAVAEISPAWKAVIVADGVGSCSHSDTASKIAVETVTRVLKESFPGTYASDKDFKSLMLIAGHTAYNAIDKYVEENDPENMKLYHTTLAFALCSSAKAYYFNAGDSAIIGLDENGRYYSVTQPDNDENGGVYSLSFRQRYQVGKVDFKPVAVIAVTDGVYAKCFPPAYKDEEYEMDVPFLNFLVSYAFGIEDSQVEEDTVRQSENIQKYLTSSEDCSDVTDDLSVSAVINTNTVLEESDIPYVRPDIISVCWKQLQFTPYSDEIKKKQFINIIRNGYPDMTDEEIDDIVDKYTSNSVRKENEI